MAQCHAPAFLSQFGLDEFALPTVVAVSPRKGVFTRFVGKFAADDIARFARLVMRGRGETQKLPSGQLVPPDATAAACAAVLADLRDDGSGGGGGGAGGGDGASNGGGDGDGDDDDDDESMADFVFHEAAAEREREAARVAAEKEAAAAAGATDAGRDPCDDDNLNEWGQKECRAKAARRRELEEEKKRLVRACGAVRVRCCAARVL